MASISGTLRFAVGLFTAAMTCCAASAQTNTYPGYAYPTVTPTPSGQAPFYQQPMAPPAPQAAPSSPTSRYPLHLASNPQPSMEVIADPSHAAPQPTPHVYAAPQHSMQPSPQPTHSYDMMAPQTGWAPQAGWAPQPQPQQPHFAPASPSPMPASACNTCNAGPNGCDNSVMGAGGVYPMTGAAPSFGAEAGAPLVCGDTGMFGMGGRLRSLVGSFGTMCMGGEPACGPPQPSRWFASAYGMLMSRSDSNSHYFSEDVANSRGVMSTADEDYPYQGGAEIRFGRRFGECQAIEAGWWAIYDTLVEDTILGANYAGGLAGRLSYADLSVQQGGVPATVDTYVDGAFAHRLRRRFSATNVELNLLQIPAVGCTTCATCDPCGGACGPCGQPSCAPGYCDRFSFGWNVGVRYLRLEEHLQFASDAVNDTYGDPLDEIFHDIDVENQLFGVQSGGHMFMQLTKRFSLFSDANVGFYGNRATVVNQIYNAEGFAYANTGPYNGQDYNLRTTENTMSVLGELRVGVHCQITRCWRGSVGYRLIGVTGVALPEDQAQYGLADYADVRRVRDHGSIMLHGFLFGLETRF